MTRGQRGQATLEVALALPVITVVALAVVQVGVVARDRVALVHAAREAIRTAIVDPGPAGVTAAARAATSLDPSRLSVEVVGGAESGDPVQVRVRYRCPTDVVVVGTLLPDIELSEAFSAVVE